MNPLKSKNYLFFITILFFFISCSKQDMTVNETLVSDNSLDVNAEFAQSIAKVF